MPTIRPERPAAATARPPRLRSLPSDTVVATLALPIRIDAIDALTAGLQAAYGPDLRLHQEGQNLVITTPPEDQAK